MSFPINRVPLESLVDSSRSCIAAAVIMPFSHVLDLLLGVLDVGV